MEFKPMLSVKDLKLTLSQTGGYYSKAFKNFVLLGEYFIFNDQPGSFEALLEASREIKSELGEEGPFYSSHLQSLLYGRVHHRGENYRRMWSSINKMYSQGSKEENDYNWIPSYHPSLC
jgi:hypothetical protein